MWIDQNVIGWCNNCNVPILDASECGICGKQSIKLNLRFKGEVRPLFTIEKKNIETLVNEYFSDSLLSELDEDSLWFFNETSRTEFKGDVIIDGKVLFEVHYNALEKSWKIKPRKDFLRYVLPQKRVVYVKDFLSPTLRNCKWVYSSWIEKIGSSIFPGEYAILDGGNVKAVGKVLKEPSIEENGRKLIEVVDSDFIIKKSRLKGSYLNEVVEANSYILEKRETNVVRNIESISRKFDLPLVASFSGGKDSSIVTNICLEYDPSVEIVFLNTGIEFPETVEFIDAFAKELRLKDNLAKISSPNNFFKLWEIFGPPSRSLRWCCKTQKFTPMNKYISTNYPKGVLCASAIRKHESLFRSNSSIIEKNQWIPKQTLLYLIKDWGLLDVWLYIFWKRLPYNPLYELGIPRVGCWPCPFQSQCIFNIMENTHPQLIHALYGRLLKWSIKHGYNEEWVRSGNWRLRNNGAPKEEIGHAEPCIEGKPMTHLVVPSDYGKRILKLLPMLTSHFESHIVDEKYIICVPAKVARKKLKTLLEKAVNCQKCGLCLETCPFGALSLDKNGISMDASKCQKCHACLAEPCIASKYAFESKVIAL